MAVYLELWKGRLSILEDVFERNGLAGEMVFAEYEAAVKIQSWFRGVRVRAYLSHLRRSATVIQKHFRGYLGRRTYRRRVKEKLKEMHESYYNSMSTKIQKVWRGFFVRSYVFDFYAQKAYLKGLVAKNQIMLKELDFHRAQTRETEERQKEAEEKEAFQSEAKRKHYMLSTVSARGPYFPSSRKSPLPLENEMRRVKLEPRDKCQKERPPSLPQQVGTQTKTFHFQSYSPDAASSIFHDVDATTWYTVSTKDFHKMMTGLGDSYTSWGTFGRRNVILERHINELNQSDEGKTLGISEGRETVPLPPLKKKVQGPFRSPEEVMRQKYKPLQPTLRVATAYESVETAREALKAEEWRMRVIDKRFEPFSRTQPKYDPQLHTKSPYQKPAYGTKHFREEEPNGRTSKKDFNTLVSPIPLFDKLNSTY